MYLVTGATGQLGRRVVKHLRQSEQPVRVLVRLMSDYRDLEALGAEILIGDLREVRDLERACQDVVYLISAHTSRNSALGASSGDIQAIDYRANIELIDRARTAGIRHVTFISLLGVERGFADAPIFKAKWEVERYLQASTLPHTILRATGLTSSWLPAVRQLQTTGVYLLLGDPETRIAPLSPDDLARLAVQSSKLAKAHNQIFAISGPQVLKRGEIPQLLGHLLGVTPRVINLPLLAVDSARAAMGLFNPQLQAELGTLRRLLTEELLCTPEELQMVEQVFAASLEAPEAFLQRELAMI